MLFLDVIQFLTQEESFGGFVITIEQLVVSKNVSYMEILIIENMVEGKDAHQVYLMLGMIFRNQEIMGTRAGKELKRKDNG